MKIILLDEWEANGKTRVEQAEEMILSLPQDYPGRNRWLFQYGQSEEAHELRASNNPSVDFNVMWKQCKTGSLNSPALTDDQVERIMKIVNEKDSEE